MTQLTAEMLERAFRKVVEDDPGPHQHVVHPRAEGWTICGDCLSPIYVVTDPQGRKREGVPPAQGSEDEG